MNQPSIAPPVAYAAEIAFEINLMREECSNAARAIVSQSILDEATLEECACLDEALAIAHQALRTALGHIHLSRAKRGGTEG